MIFNGQFSIKEKIETIQRWILVQSYLYYEMNTNVASDFEYDATANQLFEFKEEYPDEYKKSRYSSFFKDYEHGCTSGFELLSNVIRADLDLYSRIQIDAHMALEMAQKGK